MNIFDLMKKHHICRRCKGQDAYTLAGRTYCAECAERDRNSKTEVYRNPERRSKIRAQQKRIYEQRKAQGLCVRCAGSADFRHALCSKRRAKRRALYASSYHEGGTCR